MEKVELTNISVFVLSTVLSILAGFGYIVRNNEELKLRMFINSAINNGLCGLAISMIWIYKFREQIYILVGFCIIIGLMGQAGVDFILNKFKTGGLSINFGKGNKDLEVLEKEKEKEKDKENEKSDKK